MDDGLPLDTNAMASGDPGAVLALEQGAKTVTPEIMKVQSAQDYEKVPHGRAYLDPEGKQRFKPLRNKSDYDALDEGAEYADPQGQIRTKPKYEGIDFTPQTLYDIAHSDKGRRMALEKYYPGKVKEDANGELYVDDDGKLRKPGRGASSVGGFIASEAIPATLAGAGSLLGGAAGTLAEPGGGTVVGGAAGGYGGGYMGQRINDIFSQLAGVYDPEGGEANARMSGYAGAAGDFGGRALSAVAPTVAEGARAVGRGAAKTANKFLGTDPEALETGLKIAEHGEQPGAGPFGLSKAGTEVSPSAMFKASPHFANVAETLQGKFDATDPLRSHAERFMDRRAKEILEHKDIGSLVEGSLVHPKAAVSTEEAGAVIKESARLRAINQSQEADRQLQEVLARRRGEIESGLPGNHVTAYHGTMQEIETPDVSFGGSRGGVVGEKNAAFYTGNPKYAESYGDKVIKNHIDTSNSAVFDVDELVKDPEFQKDMRAALQTEAIRNDYLKQRATTPEGQAAIERRWNDVQDKIKNRPDNKFGKVRFQPEITAAIIKRAREQGVDVAIIKNLAEGHGVPADQFVVLNNKAIKPATSRIEKLRAERESVVKTAEQAKKAADDLVQQGFQDIERQVNDAMRVAQVGHNAGDLWRTVADSFVGLRRSIAQRATQMYDDAHAVSNGLVPPGAESLAPRAQALLDQLPEGFAQSHPTVVRRIAAMAGEVGENGEVIREPTAAAWTELHELRTMIRQDIKWNDLTSDVKNGALKHMQNGIDDVLHSVENQPELREASRLLRLADDFYRENMGPLNNQQIKSLVKALDSGLQADPKALLKIAIRDGRTEVANTIRNTVGPTTWNAMRAADVQEMIAQSRMLDGSIDGLKFAKQVEDRFQNGVLDVLHGEQGGARLQQQAKYIQQLRGKLPVTAQPDDTANDIILRARSAAADAEAKGAADPLKALQNEMKKVEAAVKKEMAAGKKPDQLAFLNEATVGANEAVNRILKDPDLIMAASRAFPGGEKSPEFQLMRQIWAERFMRETLEPGEKLAKVSPEIQALMFPGVTLDDMHMLAKEMKVIMSGKTLRGGGDDMGGSMMAQSAVENPWGRIGGIGKIAGPAKLVPGANFVARAALSAYYNTIRGVLTSPSTLRWLRKGLTSRDPQAREAARAELQAALQRGGAMGAGAGEGAAGNERQPDAGVLN